MIHTRRSSKPDIRLPQLTAVKQSMVDAPEGMERLSVSA